MRFKVIFRDGSQFSLFGSEYFNDKAVFWRTHQSNLMAFSTEVCQKGRPIQVIDGEDEMNFENASDFDAWYTNNQSTIIDFGFSDAEDLPTAFNEATTRLDTIIRMLSDELNELKSQPFNPWTYDGGYKRLELTCRLGLISLENIDQKIGLDDTLYTVQQLFAVPFQVNIKEDTLFTYRRKKHEDLEPTRIIEFCELILTEIEAKNKQEIQ